MAHNPNIGNYIKNGNRVTNTFYSPSLQKVNEDKEIILLEVEILDHKIDQKLHIDKIRTHGLCVCNKCHALLIGNLIIFLLIGIICAISLIVNIPKDTTVAPLGLNDSCTIGSGDCDKKLDLICPSGICICNSNKYWDGTNCVCGANKYYDGFICLSNKIYSESCSSNVPCMNYLTCNQGICACDSTKYYSNFTCLLKTGFGTQCTSYSSCQDYNGLTCFNNACRCLANYYLTNGACLIKQSNGTSCAQSLVCDDTKGLNCTNGLCLCDPSYYWDGITCQRKKTYDGSCNNNYECFSTKNLICQTVANACNCPNPSTIGVCDCPSTSYWDTATCTSRSTINGSCGADYMCLLNSNLVCTAGKCVCSSTKPTWNNGVCV